MASPFPSRRPAGKVLPSADQSPSVLQRASAPGLPIRPGVSSFQPWRIVMVIAIFGAVWLMAFSGCTNLDL